MKPFQTVISWLVLLSLLMTATSTSYAAPTTQLPRLEDNEIDVRKDVESGWKDASLGDVVWGKRIGYNDYVDFGIAVVDTIKDRDFAPLEDFFGDQIDGMMDQMSESVKEFGEAALRDLLLRAFMNKGGTILEGRLEISAGFATIDYWYDITWSEPRTYKCKWKDKITGWWTWGVCTKSKTKQGRLYQPPKFLPYIRYRVSDLPTLPQSDIVQRIEAIAQSEMLSPDEMIRLVTSQIVTAIEQRIPQIPSSTVEPSVLAAVQQAVEKYGTVDINQIVANAAAKVDEIIANQVSTYAGSLTFDWAKSNRSTIRSKVKEPGWSVVWGVNVDEVEYVKFATAVGGSVVSGGAALAAYFTEYFARTAEKIQRQAPKISRELLLDAMVKALHDPGQVFQIENLQVKAGIATYDRWLEFDYPEFTSRECDWLNIPGVGKVSGFCVDVGFNDFEFNLPNHHQPYIKFKLDDGTNPLPEGKAQVEENRVYHSTEYVSCNQAREVFVDDDAEKHGNGSRTRPLTSLLFAIGCVEDQGTVWLMPGSYPEQLIINRPVILRSTAGDVTIGE